MSIEDTTCPECGRRMVPRSGPHGKFWGCPAFPSCTGTRNSLGMSQNRSEPSVSRGSRDNAEPADLSPSERMRSRDRGRWRD
jgi:ssDNA-binding Zn-finger/Zn-ribbon topoisomerase 1